MTQDAVGQRRRPNKDDGRGTEIRETVVKLVARNGYDSVTIDEVAAASGASKATVYRRWATKADLVVDAVRGSISMPTEAPDTGDLRTDLSTLLNGAAAGLQQDADFLVALLDASRRHSDVREIMLRQFREPGRAVDRLPLHRAIARGEVSPECPTLFIDEVAMPILIHRILWHEPVDDVFVDYLVDVILLPMLTPYRLG